MKKTISIGNQSFDDIRSEKCFYIDKTRFIEEWWNSKDTVTLITRPRRFGKTLNMSMIDCFFSNKYSGRSNLFEGLYIWSKEDYRQMQGKYPVIFLSFAAVKSDNIDGAKQQIKSQIARIYEENRYLLDGDLLSDNEKKEYKSVTMYMGDVEAVISLNSMCAYMYRYYGKKVIILLDEYDTPMQEAYINGYWEEFTSFVRNLLNATFKTNQYLMRGLMTGITRVSKESIFSDLNNLNVVTTTSDEYSTCFGFTENEVFDALDMFELSDEKENVKKWYDGFAFGEHKDIYNPWSITSFLDKRKYYTYWASTSSNGLINSLIRTASGEFKELMEQLIQGKEIVVAFEEQIVFEQLKQNENAIWSLLVACGYLRVEQTEFRNSLRRMWYHLKVTNLETQGMFEDMFREWFEVSGPVYSGFMKALVSGDLEAMNYYINKISMSTFSYFDVSNGKTANQEPERFYYGFVLGLISGQAGQYEVRSNRESGFGRYDVMMIPVDRKSKLPAIVIEFKVYNKSREKTLEDSVNNALKQIEDNNYDAELSNIGIDRSQIKHYGFAFKGKEVLIGSGM